MKVELLYSSPLWVASKAIRKCWASEDKSDTEYEYTEALHQRDDGTYFNQYHTNITCGEKDKELIHRVGNKNKHKSTLEHLVYTFEIKDISRALLQELARHRMASLSVKSTRYTLKELKKEAEFDHLINEDIERAEKYIVLTDGRQVDIASILALNNLRNCLVLGIPNDKAKYCLPENYKTELVWTINARSLQNFLELRSSPQALWEIRYLAKEIFNELPEEHKYLFEEFVFEK